MISAILATTCVDVCDRLGFDFQNKMADLARISHNRCSSSLPFRKLDLVDYPREWPGLPHSSFWCRCFQWRTWHLIGSGKIFDKEHLRTWGSERLLLVQLFQKGMCAWYHQSSWRVDRKTFWRKKQQHSKTEKKNPFFFASILTHNYSTFHFCPRFSSNVFSPFWWWQWELHWRRV